jgi:hypothetical protein
MTQAYTILTAEVRRSGAVPRHGPSATALLALDAVDD